MAATEISEALVEKLGLDMSGFKAGLREAIGEGRVMKEEFAVSPGEPLKVRLRVALQRWGSTQELSAVMVGLGIRGSSLRMVQLYLAGTHTPSIEFVEVAAQLLRVPPAWLAFGDDRPSSGPALTIAQRLRALADEVEESP